MPQLSHEKGLILLVWKFFRAKASVYSVYLIDTLLQK